jgi:tetratricopeptide (TPR) repeat protein
MSQEGNRDQQLDQVAYHYYNREWRQVFVVCESIICESVATKKPIPADDEAMTRKFLAHALIGLSFEEKESQRYYRERAILESQEAIELYGEEADRVAISEAYDVHGSALQLSCKYLGSEKDKIYRLDKAIEAYEKSLQIYSENEEAKEHLQSARDMLLEYEKR